MLASVGPAAKDQGLYPGQTLANARALCPDLAVVEADREADAAALTRLAVWCERFTPLVAIDPPDSLWLDMTGCPAVGRDQGESFAQDIVGRLRTVGIPSRVAIASTSGAAWAAAHALQENRRICVIASGQEQATLVGLPIATLRLGPQILARLRRLGFRRIGELLRVPRTDLTSRFGAGPALRLDQALGHAEEAIAWLHPPTVLCERLDFVEPISTHEDLARSLTCLIHVLFRRLAEQEKGAHRFVACFYRTDAQMPCISIKTTMPSCDTTHISKLLIEKLDDVDPGFGIDVITLSAEDVTPKVTQQAELTGHAVAKALQELGCLLDMLVNRLGPERIWRLLPQESHQPERRQRRGPPSIMAVSGWIDDHFARPPIRLLKQPEPIEVTTLLPEGQPALFRWRRALHHIRSATGPERIADEWWRNASCPPAPSRARDYYRLEDQKGARFWVFHERKNQEHDRANWYLHGFFA
jgi:protein ImuB